MASELKILKSGTFQKQSQLSKGKHCIAREDSIDTVTVVNPKYMSTFLTKSRLCASVIYML